MFGYYQMFFYNALQRASIVSGLTRTNPADRGSQNSSDCCSTSASHVVMKESTFTVLRGGPWNREASPNALSEPGVKKLEGFETDLHLHGLLHHVLAFDKRPRMVVTMSLQLMGLVR